MSKINFIFQLLLRLHAYPFCLHIWTGCSEANKTFSREKQFPVYLYIFLIYDVFFSLQESGDSEKILSDSDEHGSLY